MDATSILTFPTPYEQSPEEQAMATQKLTVSLGLFGQRVVVFFCVAVLDPVLFSDGVLMLLLMFTVRACVPVFYREELDAGKSIFNSCRSKRKKGSRRKELYRGRSPSCVPRKNGCTGGWKNWTRRFVTSHPKGHDFSVHYRPRY